jgi:hypothetical protein
MTEDRFDIIEEQNSELEDIVREAIQDGSYEK